MFFQFSSPFQLLLSGFDTNTGINQETPYDIVLLMIITDVKTILVFK